MIPLRLPVPGTFSGVIFAVDRVTIFQDAFRMDSRYGGRHRLRVFVEPVLGPYLVHKTQNLVAKAEHWKDNNESRQGGQAVFGSLGWPGPFHASIEIVILWA